jgi:membrane-associated protease RseP (regulator of RpoE activity)
VETAEPSPSFSGTGLRPARKARTLTFPRILVHLGLLVATAVTTTIMGTLLAVPAPSDDLGVAGTVAALAHAAVSSPEYLTSGIVFSFTLLVILGAHELGHYFACRYYDIDASLPYFLPAPPPILIGTFGAFIRIRSPFPSRRALFDVGVAGPIAGFCFAVPAALVGLLFAASSPAPSAGDGTLVFHDPMLFVLVERAFHLPASIAWNPIYFAAWIGMFATGLNLLPVGQLDGGHAVAALVGRRGHRIVSLGFFAAVVALAVISFARFESPVWFLYVVLLAFLAFRAHPPTLVEEADIGAGRRLAAVLVALIFALTFMPFPITVN